MKRQSAPHYANDTAYWATNNYDAFRLQSQVVPASGGATATTSMTYNGLTTTTQNALGQTRTEIRNAAGELVEVDDYLGGKVLYAYDAAGQLVTTTTWAMQAGAGVTLNTYLDYDLLGRKIKLRDSDKGTWFYGYNAFGELTDQYKVMSAGNYGGTLADAIADSGVLLQHTHMDYDARGRVIARSDYRETRPLDSVLEGASSWTYDSATHGLGQLAQESGGGLTRTYSYDTLGRPSATLHNDGAGSYVMAVAYDAYGRADRQYDALSSSSGTQTTYNNYGYPVTTLDIASGTPLHQVQAMDARGNVTQAVLSNGATGNWNYDAGSGLLLAQTAAVGTSNLQNLAYTWDALGNQTSRWDQGNGKNLQQSFCYDGLNRLIKTNEGSLNGACSLGAAQQDQEYDGFGSITRKNNVGTYTYSAAHPHQLQATSDGVSYSYDAVGNMTSDTSNRTLHYTVFDKPDTISKLNNQITFAYDAGRNLYKRADSDGSTTTATYTIGNIEKVVKAGGSYDIKRYLPGGGLWTYHFDSSGTQTGLDKQTLLKDVLGSVTLVTDGVGVVKQQLAFNAWGERVNTGDWKTVLPSTTFLPVSQQFTTHGYTGQDMLDAVGLIHYGGRIYDARLGRFVQADPVVQDGEDLQAYNRYAYVRNNPLTLTDPSGFSFLSKAWHGLTHAVSKVWQAVRPYVGVIASAVMIGMGCYACAAEFNAAWTIGNGGSLKDGLIAGVSTYALQFLPGGGSFASMTAGQIAKETLISGVAGGVMWREIRQWLCIGWARLFSGWLGS